MSKKTKQRTATSAAKQRRISIQNREFEKHITMLDAQFRAAQNSQLLSKKAKEVWRRPKAAGA